MLTELTLDASTKDFFIPLGTNIDLVCLVAPAYGAGGRVNFKMNHTIAGSAIQLKHSCMPQTGYLFETECDRGTDDQMSNSKVYTLIIPVILKEQYTEWQCELKRYEIKSDILNLKKSKLLLFIKCFIFCLAKFSLL